MTHSPFSFVIPFQESEPERTKSFWWLKRRLTYLFPWAPIVEGADSSEVFNRSLARNNGIKEVTTEYVFIVDSDTVFNGLEVAAGIRLLRAGAPWVIPYETYYRMNQESSRLLVDGSPHQFLNHDNHGYDYVITTPPAPGHDLPQAGLLGFRTDDINAIGGYCTDFRGWGWEDRALVTVADRLLGPHERWNSGEVFHIWHPEPSALTWNQPEFEFNKALSQKFDSANPAELVRLNGPI